MYKLLIFDFDGTLADTTEPIVQAKQETMRQLGLEVMSYESCKATIGLSSPKGFKKQYPDMTDEMAEYCTVTYRKIFEEIKEKYPITSFPHVKETLVALKKKGAILTIATSRNTPSVHELLTKLELKDLFDYILGGNDTDRHKPDPEPVNKTLRELKYDASEALVIGDMPYDILMGVNSSVKTCGVTYGNSNREELLEYGADYIIDDMSELIDICQ